MQSHAEVAHYYAGMKRGQVAVGQELLEHGWDMSRMEFCRYGQELVEWIADYLENPRKYPVVAQTCPGDLRRQLSSDAPTRGVGMDSILCDFRRLIVPNVTHWNHPRFHGYFSISASSPGILAELLTAALNCNAMLWKNCPAATELEQTTLSWVLDWLGLPPTWFGMIVDSASSAALQAILAARQLVEPESRATGPSGRLVAYISEHTHSSIEKAAMAAGIGRLNLRHVVTDHAFRMNPKRSRKRYRLTLHAV